MVILAREISQSVRRLSVWFLGFALVAAMGVTGRSLTPNGPHPDPTQQREILLNGLRILSTEQPGDRVAVVCVIRAGAMFDPTGKSGLANLTAGLLAHGAGSYSGDRIRAELDDSDAKIAVHTTWDAVVIEGETRPDRLATLFDVMSLMVSEPRFAPADVEAAKKFALEHIAGELAAPDLAADRFLARSIYGKHSYGRSVWGDTASVTSIIPGDLREFYDRLYGANSSVLAVSGPVPFDTITQLARNRFGRWAKRKVVPATFLPPVAATETRVVVVDRPGLERPVVRAGFFGPGRSTDDAVLLKVVASRLEASLKQKLPGAEDVTAGYDIRILQSPMSVGFVITMDKLSDALAATADAVGNLSAGTATGPSTRYFPHGDFTVSTNARLLALTEFYSGQKLVADPVDFTPDEGRVTAVARSASRPGALTFVVVGDGARITAALKDKFKIEQASGS